MIYERITKEELDPYTDKDKEAAYIYYLMNKGYSYAEKIIKNQTVTESEYAKISENIEKITNPGKKKLWRVFSKETGYGLADLLTFYDEEVDMSKPYPYVDPVKPWKKMYFSDVEVKEMQIPIFKDGELVYEKPTLDEIKAYVSHQLKNQVWEEEQRYENPHTHYVDLSKELYKVKAGMLEKEY